MDRIQIIKELAQYAHPSWYHHILNWPTSSLKQLLDFYKSDKDQTWIDFNVEDIDIVIDFKVGEPLKNVMKFKH